MSYQGHDGRPPRGGPGRSDSAWTKISTIAGVVGVVVAVVAAYFAYLAIPQPSPATPPIPPGASALPTVAPSPSEVPDVPTASDPPPKTTIESPAGRQEPRSDPPTGLSLTVSPVAVDLGGEVTIVGSGFEPAEGLQVRLFRTDSISYPVGPDQIVAGGNGRFTIRGRVDNPGWCGSGTIAVFRGSGSAIGPPPSFGEAVVTGRLGVVC